MARYSLSLVLALLWASVAYAGPPATIRESVGVCDYANTANCIKPDVNGAVPVTGSFSATTSQTSTAAAPTYVEGTTNPLSGDLSGGLRVDCIVGCAGGTASNASSGVVTSSTNGTTNAWLYGFNGTTWDQLLVDGSKNLKTIINAALPAGTNVIGHAIIDSGSTTVVSNITAALPAGTNVIGHVIADTGSTTAVTQATAANLNATIVGLGTAGSASGGVLTVQGVASMTPLLSTLQTQTDTVMVGGVNVKEINGVAPLMGNGVTGTGSPRVTIASDSSGIITTGTAGAASAQVLTVQGIASMTKLLVTPDSVALPANQSVNISQINAVTPLMGNGVTGTGSLRVTIASDNTANSNPFLVTQVPSATTAGTTLFTLTLANTTNATNVKASAGNLFSISGFNMSSATPVWISLYNNSGTPTCGSSIIQQFMIPGNTTGSGFVYDFANPKNFSAGIAFCATTGIAGTGAPAATTYVVNIDYK